jgi:endoglucanase
MIRVRLVTAAVLLLVGGRSPIDSPSLLDASWRGFRKTFITAEGRVHRPDQGDDTVSEGQAYAMLRAAWMNDQPMFDTIWQWTRTHLVRGADPGDPLLAWHWSPHSMAVVDRNFASDADVDYAFALLLASVRWNTPSDGRASYADEALRVLDAVLRESTARDHDGRLVLLPGSWAATRVSDAVVLNPSYFAPAWYRVFFQVTKDRRWLELVDTTYAVLDSVCQSTDGPRAIPDWIEWQSIHQWRPWKDREPESGWEAVRVPWRIGSDWLWFHSRPAADILDRCLAPVAVKQLSNGRGPAVRLSLSGKAIGEWDDPLANAMIWFCLKSESRRDRLLTHLTEQVTRSGDGEVYFGEGHRYYVNSLAYLPWLVDAGRYTAPSR